jgi:hypothetical protein
MMSDRSAIFIYDSEELSRCDVFTNRHHRYPPQSLRSQHSAEPT